MRFLITRQRHFISILFGVLLPLNLAVAQNTTLSPSLAKNGCLNVVIVNDFAYAACGQEIEVINLETLQRGLVSVSADDVTADLSAGLLFTQSRNNLTMLSLDDPFQPSPMATATTNFSAFSGVSASSGVLVVSGGAGGSNTQIYNYTPTSLVLSTSGIPVIDSATGNPDVHLAQTSTGLAAFYSQDTGGVANFAIQAVSLSNLGQVTSIASDVVLTPGQFDFSLNLGPSNFPVESEFLNGRLYVAHFAAQGLEVINTAANDGKQLEQTIPLSFVPTNVATDGEVLFVVGSANNSVAVINPVTRGLIARLTADQVLLRPTGVAASSEYVVVADRVNGLIVIDRTPEPRANIGLAITPVISLLLDSE